MMREMRAVESPTHDPRAVRVACAVGAAGWRLWPEPPPLNLLDLTKFILCLRGVLEAIYSKITCELRGNYVRITCVLRASYVSITCELRASYVRVTCVLAAASPNSGASRARARTQDHLECCCGKLGIELGLACKSVPTGNRTRGHSQGAILGRQMVARTGNRTRTTWKCALGQG